MITLKPADVIFAKASIVDQAGKVFFYQDRVFRAVYSKEFAGVCSEIFSKEWVNEVFEAGLVGTWISNDVFLEGAFLTLEHEKIPYETHPAEASSYMHWLSAKATVQTALALSKHGYILKDAHPWNIMFYRGFPKFIDFGSISKTNNIPTYWLAEFRQYFGVPIWLASRRWNKLSIEYRREHLSGFGLMLFELKYINKMVMGSLNKTIIYKNNPELFFLAINNWLDKHKPDTSAKGNWSEYEQAHESDPLSPKTVKQKFVYSILSHEKPRKVLDCAANNGYYSEMAVKLGASVAAFDYEEHCVDACLSLSQREYLDITPVIMNFSLPTGNHGLCLMGDDAFTRFNSDIVLALGLMHHLCIRQNLPVNLFCDSCMKYANKGIIVEYVDPLDRHVRNWNQQIPANYSLDYITYCFHNKFKLAESTPWITDNGLRRIILYYRN